MALYKFHCENCGEEFEELVSAKDGSDVECPKCYSKEKRQVFSDFGFKMSGECRTTASSHSGEG